LKAIVYSAHGGPEVLRWEDAPVPECHRKGIVIQVEAVSVEGGDLLDRSGNFAPLEDHALVIGRQAAGTIVAVERDAKGFAIGGRAVCVRPSGSHAELFAAPARTSWPIPDRLDIRAAAALPIAFGTAHDALHHYGKLQPGDSVLVQAAGSGVGIAAIQLARLGGAGTVIATGSSDEKLDRLRSFGADHTVNYRSLDVPGEVARLTGGRGVDLLLDTVGGDSLQGSLQSMARGGRLVAIGQASRTPIVVDLKNLYAQGVTLSGFKLDIASGRLHQSVTRLLKAAEEGQIRVVLDRTFPLAEAAAAHGFVESREAFGRVLLLPAQAASLEI
jgi:NADPH2:quinone reductase